MWNLEFSTVVIVPPFDWQPYACEGLMSKSMQEFVNFCLLGEVALPLPPPPSQKGNSSSSGIFGGMRLGSKPKYAIPFTLFQPSSLKFLPIFRHKPGFCKI